MANPFSNKRLPMGMGMLPQDDEEMMNQPMEEEQTEIQETPEMEAMELLNPMQVLYHDENEACGSCEYFVEDGGDCKKVQGPISQSGWCILHSGRGGAQEAMEVPEEQVMQDQEMQLPFGG